MWKAKENVETVLGSTLEQCCEPIYCALAFVSKTLGYAYQYVRYVLQVFLADEFKYQDHSKYISEENHGQPHVVWCMHLGDGGMHL